MTLETIKQRAKSLGLTRQEIAALVGVSRFTVWRWFTGRTNISMKDFIRLEEQITKLERDENK